MKVKLMLKIAQNDQNSPENTQGAGGNILEDKAQIKEVEFVTGLKFDRILGNNNSLIKVNTGIS